MKTLLLIRHAKSSWDDITMNDADRPLNERGKKNAPEMAKRLYARKIRIDAFLSSPAKRALTTARYFAEEFGLPKNEIDVVPELYMAGTATFLNIIRGISDELETVAIFSHNNGITEFANRLTNVRLDNMPTCAIFAVRSHIDNWSDFQEHDNDFLFFDYPKKIQ